MLEVICTFRIVKMRDANGLIAKVVTPEIRNMICPTGALWALVKIYFRCYNFWNYKIN